MLKKKKKKSNICQKQTSVLEVYKKKKKKNTTPNFSHPPCIGIDSAMHPPVFVLPKKSKGGFFMNPETDMPCYENSCQGGGKGKKRCLPPLKMLEYFQRKKKIRNFLPSTPLGRKRKPRTKRTKVYSSSIPINQG
jgi:hypothetical protein